MRFVAGEKSRGFLAHEARNGTLKRRTGIFFVISGRTREEGTQALSMKDRNAEAVRVS